MCKVKKWSIKQVINGVVYFNQSFMATKEDYLVFRNLLLIPNRNEFIDYKVRNVKAMVIKNKRTHEEIIFKNCVFTNENYKRLKILVGRMYDNVIVDEVGCWYPRFMSLPNIIKQGKNFEYYVSNYFKTQGYFVINNFEKEKNDEGIDIIAKKDNELLLIQCKNWEIPVISHKEIKEFLGNCYLFLYNHIEYRKFKKVRRIYITSQSNLDMSAKYLLKNNYPFVEHLQISFKN